MAGEVDHYLQTRANFKEADDIVNALADLMRRALAGLSDTRALFHFSNTPTGLPPEVIMNPRSPSIDATQWPSAEKIQERLVTWHTALRAMQAAYEAIPANLREGLQRPLGPVRR